MVVHAASLDRHGIQMLRSLIVELGVTQGIIVDCQLASVTARSIVVGADSVSLFQ